MTGLAGRLVPSDLASKAAALSLGANFCLMLLKLVVGLISGSIVVISNGIDSAQDMVAALIVFISVQIGRRPADAGHPFGHRRAETIAAAVQAVMIGAGAAFIAFTAVNRLQNPPESIGAPISV